MTLGARIVYQHSQGTCVCKLTLSTTVQQVFALGFVSVFDQITEGLPGTGPDDIFKAYMTALQEDPEQYRKYVAAAFVP